MGVPDRESASLVPPVHVWFVPVVAGVVPAGLPAAEAASIESLGFPADRDRAVTARSSARRVLGERLGVAPSEVPLLTGGRPVVSSQRMEIRGEAKQLLNSVLPHEVTHTVLAHHFGRAVPRWADEGGVELVLEVVDRGRSAAIAFYESSGWRHTETVVADWTAGDLSANRFAPVYAPPRNLSHVRSAFEKRCIRTSRSTTPIATSALAACRANSSTVAASSKA